MFATTAVASLSLAVSAKADDINVTTNVTTGINLDAAVGTTATISPGVTVTNVDFSRAITATAGPWTVTNRGDITSKFANTIQLDVTNSAVVNFGSITAGSSSNAVWLIGGGAVDNKVGATISSNLSAIRIGTSTAGVGNVTNAGTITQTGTSGDLVTLLFGGTVTNLAGGTITANNASNAVSVGQGASRTVINSGTIVNTGASFASGVLVQGGASTVTNNVGGIIRGTYNGVYASASAAMTFTNAGLIESTGPNVSARAVEATGGGTLVNTGTIKSASSDGLYTARGATVTNSGTIQGAVNAINFSGNFARTLNLDTGSVLIGKVQGGSGVDNLVLLGSGSDDISKFLAFETLSLQGTAWTLSGAGSFATSAAVQSGKLTVAGTLTTPTLTVGTGGTLTGTGTVAGATTIASGGTLAGQASHVLTLGSLALGAGSNVNVALGAPSNSALFQVTGPLTVGGLLNVTDAGGFGLGTYRLFNYGGALTNNGLVITSVPLGFNPGDWAIDTATAGQFNLLVLSGAGAQYWDGANTTPGGVANGRGGSGVWNSANTNWTNAAGTINASWVGAKAVFAAAGASTVTVAGAQAFSGLRFLGGADYTFNAGTGGGLVTTGVMAPVILDQSAAQTTTARISVPISGTGGITKSGAGKLVLTGANTYSGGTTVAEGTLDLGGGGTSGSITGDVAVTAGAIFAINRSDVSTFGGVISGTGAFTKQGAGKLVLTAANTQSGGTTVAEGTLDLGGGGTSGSITGDVAVITGATFAINRSDATTFGGVIAGTGGFTKQGTGILTVSGNSAGFAGSSTIQAGTFALAGTLGGSLAVGAGARLQGTGTAGAVSLASGGTIAPGNSIGTLAVGSIGFAPGSIYEVEANDAGQADRINVTEAAVIGGGTVQVLAQNGTYGVSTQYTILSAAGGVSGPGFSGATSNLAFLTPSLQQTANAVLLTLKRNTIDFDAVDGTINQRAVGRGVQSLGTGAVYDAVLGLDLPGARAAFDAVSGEIHVSLLTTLFEDSRFPREAVLRRLEGANGHGVGVWAEGFGSWAKNDTDGNAARLTRDSAGFVTGIDTALGDNWHVGLAGGYSHHTLDLPDRLSSGSVRQTYGLAYAGGEYGPVRISLGAGYSHLSAHTDRSAVFTGFADRLRAAYGGSIIQGFGELGYRIGLNGGSLEPFARVAVVNLATDGFTEAGGAAALRAGSTNETRTTTTLGLQFATPIAGALSVDARVGWRHAFGGVTPLSTLQFASGGSAFAVAGAPLSREAGVAEGGVTWQASPALAFWARYSGVIGDQGQDNSVKGGISLAF